MEIGAKKKRLVSLAGLISLLIGFGKFVQIAYLEALSVRLALAKSIVSTLVSFIGVLVAYAIGRYLLSRIRHFDFILEQSDSFWDFLKRLCIIAVGAVLILALVFVVVSSPPFWPLLVVGIITTFFLLFPYVVVAISASRRFTEQEAASLGVLLPDDTPVYFAPDWKPLHGAAWGVPPGPTAIIISEQAATEMEQQKCQSLIEHEHGHIKKQHSALGYLGGIAMAIGTVMIYDYQSIVVSLEYGFLFILAIGGLVLRIVPVLRNHEFEADEIAAEKVGETQYVQFLKGLKQQQTQGAGQRLLSTHPPIDDRIQNIKCL